MSDESSASTQATPNAVCPNCQSTHVEVQRALVRRTIRRIISFLLLAGFAGIAMSIIATSRAADGSLISWFSVLWTKPLFWIAAIVFSVLIAINKSWVREEAHCKDCNYQWSVTV
jgi:fructose-specific phosphotransferase system IIC component